MRTFDSTATALAFPLGGIGTGTVSLGARGDLRDWEIFNRAAKGSNLPNSFFVLRVQPEGANPITRVIEGPVQPPYTASHGFHPTTNAGLPRFQNTTFRGEYPFAWVDFHDETLPVAVKLEAFNPLIPLNPEDSGIPCAILTYTVTNTGDTPLDLTLVGSIMNPVGGIIQSRYDNVDGLEIGQSRNQFRDDSGFRGLFCDGTGIPADDLRYGSLALVTDHPDVTAKPVWLRGAWFDFLQDFWDDLTNDGRLDDLGYTEPGDRPNTGSLGVVNRLEPGESRSYRFVLAWHIPNRVNSWDRNGGTIRNHYATRFDDAWTVAHYVMEEYTRLDSDSRRFHQAFFDSNLPDYVLDAVSANIVPVRSNTCFWLEDGRFFGWEGCFDDGGCCPGTCTHVWSYTYTVAYLFPSLEREMRRIEFVSETDPDGYMAFRTFRTFDPARIWGGDQRHEAAVDGQMGSILRVYREWLLSEDREWLATVWPGVKRAIDFASAQWDIDQDGVLDGKQHNTYDIEFYGPNPLSTFYYLAGLRAVEELAKVMDEPDVAARCHAVFKRGSQRADELMWNGEYYIQQIDDVNAHKYQHGTGCLTDQLLGQLHATALGLGDLLPTDHVQTALQSIYAYNFRQDFHDHVNCQRTYILNDESGVVLCSWPKDGRPRLPFVYADEVWTGFEYHFAAHLIFAGKVDQGLTIVKAVRDRHDGIKRNPWNEVECGHHYARTMSSWLVLLALMQTSDDVRAFWSDGRQWGSTTDRS